MCQLSTSMSVMVIMLLCVQIASSSTTDQVSRDPKPNIVTNANPSSHNFPIHDQNNVSSHRKHHRRYKIGYKTVINPKEQNGVNNTHHLLRKREVDKLPTGQKVKRQILGHCEQECTYDYNPVCGVDGYTYNNWCLIQCAGVDAVHTGLCSNSMASYSRSYECQFCSWEYDPVCGENGRTYDNWCLLKCAGVEASYPGACRTPNHKKCTTLLCLLTSKRPSTRGVSVNPYIPNNAPRCWCDGPETGDYCWQVCHATLTARKVCIHSTKKYETSECHGRCLQGIGIWGWSYDLSPCEEWFGR